MILKPNPIYNIYHYLMKDGDKKLLIEHLLLINFVIAKNAKERRVSSR